MNDEAAREVAWWWCIKARHMKVVVEKRDEELSRLREADYRGWWYEREARRLEAERVRLTAELDALRGAKKRKR